MSIVLYVWKIGTDGNPGHASLQVGSTYMSYWPQSPAGKNDIKLGQTHAAVFPSSYRVDVRLEGKDSHACRPLQGLDEQAMAAAWSAFTQNPARYNMVSHNCSTVIASMLQIGSKVAPSFVSRIGIDDHTSNMATRLFLRLRFLSSSIRMWTPDALLRYADEIQRRLSTR